MAFSLTEQDVAWLESAPARYSQEGVVGADPAAVFATLADHAGWPTWFKGMRKAQADGTGTGVGATRTVWLGPLSAKEKFVAWEPGSQFSFCVVEASAPGLRSLVEDFRLEALGEGRTTVRYTVGIAGSGPSFLNAGLKAAARRIVTGGLEGLAAHHR